MIDPEKGRPAFGSVALVGFGLIGSSIARSVREAMPAVRLTAYDADEDVRKRATSLDLVDLVAGNVAEAVSGAELVILCTPVGAIVEAARSIAPYVSPDAVVSDVGSAKAEVARGLREALPNSVVVPAHPIAGTENSGPEAGFAGLFRNRWCILTPDSETDPAAVARLTAFWTAIGARVGLLDPARHDLVLAVTSHLPHLIAFTIVGTASHLEAVTESEVIKYSAGGFRDFTRLAASDPVMWRDIFLANREAVLDMLGRLRSDLDFLETAIRDSDGEALFEWFSRTRAIRRAIVYEGQDVAAPDFGRPSGQGPSGSSP